MTNAKLIPSKIVRFDGWLPGLMIGLAGFIFFFLQAAAAQNNGELMEFHGTLAGLPPQAQSVILQQLAELTASDEAAGDYLGLTVAISGNTVVVGAPYEAIGSNTWQGAAYVFVKPAVGWTSMVQTAKLTASDGTAFSNFGLAASVYGKTIAIESGDGTASVYVFVEPQSGWVDMTETAELTTPINYYGGGPYPSVATNGNTVVVGVPSTKYRGQQFEGVAYVFVEPTVGWTGMTQTATLYASDGGNGGYFGSSLSLSSSGNTVVVCGSGRAYVFIKPRSGWSGTRTQTAELTASNGDGLSSAALEGNTVVAGAPGATIGSNQEQGAAYVFIKPSTGWGNATENAKLTASDGAASDMMGNSVALNSNANVIAAGAPYRSSSTGAVYVFVKPTNGWANITQTTELTASDGAPGDFLGESIAVSGFHIVAGAPQFGVSEPGAAYVFGPGQ